MTHSSLSSPGGFLPQLWLLLPTPRPSPDPPSPVTGVAPERQNCLTFHGKSLSGGPRSVGPAKGPKLFFFPTPACGHLLIIHLRKLWVYYNLKVCLEAWSFKNLSCPLNQFQNHWSGVGNMKTTRSVKSVSFLLVSWFGCSIKQYLRHGLGCR